MTASTRQIRGPRRANLVMETLEDRMVPAAAGFLDPTFGVSGAVLHSVGQFGTPGDSARATAVQNDGRIVVVGSSVGLRSGLELPGLNSDYFAARFNNNGTLDTSFGNNGQTTVGFNLGGALNDDAHAVAVDSQGRILVGGTVELNNGNRDFGVVRLLANGRLDASFGNGGRAVVAFDRGGDYRDDAYALAIDQQGRILVAGKATYQTNDSDFAVARLTADGQLDFNFGTGGKRTVAFVNSASLRDAVTGVAVDSQGRIILGGYSEQTPGSYDFAIARLTSSGSLDSSFDFDGRQTVAFNRGGSNSDTGSAVAIDYLDRIVVAGTVAGAVGSDFGAIRLNTNGFLDPTFGFLGQQVVSFGRGTNADFASDVAIDHQGRIVLSGTANFSGANDDIGVVRLTATGQIDTTFGNLGNGRSEIFFDRGGTRADRGHSLAIDREGRIVVVGQVDTGSRTDIAVARVDGGDSIRVVDASGDSTPGAVFRGGAVRVSYHFANFNRTPAPSGLLLIEAVRNGATTILHSDIFSPTTGGPADTYLVNLADVANLAAGDYQVRVRLTTSTGQSFLSASTPLRVQTGSTVTGTLQGETFTHTAAAGSAAVYLGAGGTDTLDLGVNSSGIATVNGLTFGEFAATRSTYRQAIYRGSAYDYLRLNDGREVYFQGIERLRLADGQVVELALRPNDPQFVNQWNLHTTDVPGAWRFSTGDRNVLLVSLDTGIVAPAGQGGPYDMTSGRLVINTQTDIASNSDHGHASISVMASTANNGSGVAGINWGSTVRVADIYGGVSLQDAIRQALEQARATGQRVVFQGGIQGEYWLNSGGTQAQLEALFRDNADIAIFAVAAGNGGTSTATTTEVRLVNGVPTDVPGSRTAGVARLAASHGNVMAVGALQRSAVTVAGMANASVVNRASYSNFGPALTLMAPTDSPAVEWTNIVADHTGTSCANPNLAGISSLVWSVNPLLTGATLRQVLIDTAMDIGTAGRDDTFGHGLVNADAAVRRARALAGDSEVALLMPHGRSAIAAPSVSSNQLSGPTTPPRVPSVEKEVMGLPTTTPSVVSSTDQKSSRPPERIVTVRADVVDRLFSRGTGVSSSYRSARALAAQPVADAFWANLV